MPVLSRSGVIVIVQRFVVAPFLPMRHACVGTVVGNSVGRFVAGVGAGVGRFKGATVGGGASSTTTSSTTNAFPSIEEFHRVSHARKGNRNVAPHPHLPVGVAAVDSAGTKEAAMAVPARLGPSYTVNAVHVQ
jgi:hypothetical protein